MKTFTPKNSYLRVATATPAVRIADTNFNYRHIKRLYLQAVAQHVSLVAFPELCITGYSLGDTVRQNALLAEASLTLVKLAKLTTGNETAMVVGLPYRHNGRLYNVVALVADGNVCGMVTKTNLPNYAEFYEQRWYQPYSGSTSTIVNSKAVPFGQNLLFTVDGISVGIEICEDVWVPNQPSRELTNAGALIIINPSASPELVGKAAYRRELIRMTSAVERCAYIYAGADWTESTTDIVMGGHALITENGSILAERQPFTAGRQLMIADIDIDHLSHDRIQDTTRSNLSEMVQIETGIIRTQTDLQRRVPKSYFLPEYESAAQRSERLASIITIQAHGLARRLIATQSQKIVLGLSGGLDSTLALLVAYESSRILKKPAWDFIHAITMPSLASSHKTQSNAVTLAKTLGVHSATIPISNLTLAQLKALQHEGEQDITYENVQARTRTMLLFNYANQHGGLVLGTGDLSELALGWCTFGGDHLSNYNVNGSIPKTLVRDLVQYCADLSEFRASKSVLEAIIATPISPELTTTKKGELSQTTESLIGPYELHDFFLYHVLRYGDAPAKILFLANKAFTGQYSETVIGSWLALFYERFARSQFKRSTLPDGPKIGSVSLSPRGDWRMPSDMSDALWK